MPGPDVSAFSYGRFQDRSRTGSRDSSIGLIEVYATLGLPGRLPALLVEIGIQVAYVVADALGLGAILGRRPC